jgi:hypothetical protein
LPAVASAFNAAIAEKSFVNDEAEMLGVGAAAAVLVEALVELDELELELPQATTPTLATSTSATGNSLLFSKCTMTLLFRPLATTRRGHATLREPPGDCHTDPIWSQP